MPLVERPRSATQNDVELEALGGVDRHQLHRVGRDPAGGCVGLGELREGAVVGGVVEEVAQAATFGGLEAAREAQQLVDVREAPVAGVECEDVLFVAGGDDRAHQQLGDAERGHEAALLEQALGEAGKTVAIRRGELGVKLAVGVSQGVPYAGLRRAGAQREQRETVAGEPDER